MIEFVAGNPIFISIVLLAIFTGWRQVNVIASHLMMMLGNIYLSYVVIQQRIGTREEISVDAALIGFVLMLAIFFAIFWTVRLLSPVTKE